MNTSEVLNRAADLIEERGWQQGFKGWRAGTGAALCMEGAIAAAMGIEDPTASGDISSAFEGCPAYTAVMRHLKDDSRWSLFRDHIFDWNDVYDRKAYEVTEVLRACAVIEASREREAAEVSA